MKLLNLGCGGRWHEDWINLDFNSSSKFVQRHNLYEPLPFEDASIDVVYSSHVLEHFPKCFAPKFLIECGRVLKKSGIIRIVVPDLEQIVRNYLTFLGIARAGDKDGEEKYDWTMIELFDQMVRNISGGEMLEYWKQDPMPQEDFVIERLGLEVKSALKLIRQNSRCHSKKDCFVQDSGSKGMFRLRGEIHQWMYDSFSLGRLLKEVGFDKVRQCAADESSIPNFCDYLLDIESDGSVRKPDSLFIEGIKS